VVEEGDRCGGGVEGEQARHGEQQERQGAEDIPAQAIATGGTGSSLPADRMK